MQDGKLNFFEQIYYAVFKPKQYYRLTKISNGRLTGFVFLFALITGLFTVIPMFYDLLGPGGFTQYMREDLPEFEFNDGRLFVEDRYETEADIPMSWLIRMSRALVRMMLTSPMMK
jgi:hypothetical protein